MKNRLVSLKRIVERETGHRIDLRRGKTEVTFARAVFCKVAREMHNNHRPISYSTIGEVISKDHATVMHNVKVVFPFAVKEPSFNNLYKTLRAMFINNDEIQDFDELAAVSDRLIALQKENDALKYKLLLTANQDKRFSAMTEDLSDEEMGEVYERLDLMIRSIKSRVYN